MYREPHLNDKSKECSDIWYEWYEWKYNRREDPLASSVARELRVKWCKCADELGDMVHETLITDPRYEGWEDKMDLAKKKKPR